MFDIVRSYFFVIFGDLLVSKVKTIIMITIVNNSNNPFNNYVLFICRILLGEFIELSLDYGETAESS